MALYFQASYPRSVFLFSSDRVWALCRNSLQLNRLRRASSSVHRLSLPSTDHLSTLSIHHDIQPQGLRRHPSSCLLLLPSSAPSHGRPRRRPSSAHTDQSHAVGLPPSCRASQSGRASTSAPRLRDDLMPTRRRSRSSLPGEELHFSLDLVASARVLQLELLSVVRLQDPLVAPPRDGDTRASMPDPIEPQRPLRWTQLLNRTSIQIRKRI